MKKIILTAAVAAITLGFNSCSIDDVENITELSQSVFPATQEDAEAVLAGVYQNLNETHANPQMSFLYLACLASDDQLGGGGSNDKLMQAEDLMLSSGYDMTNQFYNDRYKGVARANVLISVLAKDPEKPMTKQDLTPVQSQALGEALALRAFYFYELASMYGNVPLVRNADEAEATQGDVAVLWGQILQDYRDAILLMNSESNVDKMARAGHLDKYAVEGLAARAWLFYTGMYGNGSDIAALTSTTYSPLSSVNLPDGSTLTKQDVIGWVDDAVTMSNYDLVPDFRNLWAYSNKLTKADYLFAQGAAWAEDDKALNIESMFAIKFNKQASWSTTIGYANGIALHFGVRGGQPYGDTFPFGQGWGAGPVTENLVTDWANAEPTDMRRAATIQDWRTQASYTKGGGNDFVQETDFYEKKWSPITCKRADGTYAPTFENDMYPGGWDISGVDNFQLGNIHDLILLRYADLLLMQSELNENVSGINRVRERAGLTPITAYSLQALQNERRWELACEGIRWNDIRRWHIAAAALEKQTDTNIYIAGTPTKNTAHNGGYAARYNATAGFAKMPETQVALGLVQQNPGWENGSDYGGW
ncbi:MAG: RagB/SusD family nutrient uptake outer membrane protein [Bacteroidaceae bacterium]|nr:RagB/SusD family nutrient uptake outer membrane protein [Bacteroidaceae bacterium]